MSQYPSPYSTPAVPLGYGEHYFQSLLAPARRAGMMLMILGAVTLMCGLCLGLFALMGPVNEIISRSGVDLSQATSELGVTPERFVRVVYMVLGVLSLLVAVVMLILGFFVRRGGKTSIVTSIVFCILITLVFLLQLLVGLVNVARAPSATGALGILIVLVLLGLFGLTFMFLFQAIRAESQVRAMQMQYQAQYWQYQQQQQMYGQAGYGYPQPPAEPPPPQNPAAGPSEPGPGA